MRCFNQFNLLLGVERDRPFPGNSQFKSLYILLLFLSPFLLKAQPTDINWENTFGDSGNEVFHQVIEASNGYLIAVGETTSNTKGGKDGLLVIADHSTGSKMVEYRFGGKKDDILKSVVQTFEGNFLLAGYTESKGKGKEDAWLIKVDERGNVVWEETYGSAGDDKFLHVELLKDGTTVLAGYLDGNKQGDIWLYALKDKEYLWQQFHGRKNYSSVMGLTQTRDGGIALVGNTSNSSKAKNGDIWLLKTNNLGQLEWEKFFGGKDWDEAAGLIETSDGGLAICGSTNSIGSGDLDMWLVKTSSTGFLQWEEAYGGKDADIANSLIQTEDNNFLLVGATKSHRSGARQNKAMIVKTNSGGERQWEYSYGGNKEDYGTDLIELHDGSLVMTGMTSSSGKGGDNAWMLRWIMGDGMFSGSLTGAKNNAFEFSQTILNTTDGQLKPEDQTYLSFDIHNNAKADISNVQVRVTQKTGDRRIRLWTTNYVGTVKRESSTNVKIPVTAGSDLETGDNVFGLSVVSGNQEMGDLSMTIRSKKPIEAGIEIDNYTFEDSRTSDEETLNVVVQNPGDFTASNVSIRFELPPGIRAVSPLTANVGSVRAHGSRTVKFTYVKTAAFRDDRLAIACVVKMGQREIRKTLERGAALSDEVVMIITHPDETREDIKNIISEGNIYDIKIAVGATSQLKQQDFKVYNNSLAIDGSKMDEVELSQKASGGNRYVYNFNSKVHLVPGENHLEVEVATPGGAFRTKKITVYFQPRKSNLHVLAIGPTMDDLKFTSKDAADFADAYRTQGGEDKLFGKVFVKSLVRPEDTEADDIREAISDLVFQHENPAASSRILENDVLMVFVSTHGKNNREGFKLLPSNYDSRYERTRTIDYQRDVVQELERINCKKLVFIDACQSGAADSKSATDIDRANALTKLAAMHPGMSTLTSCGNSEMSYEDEAWQNGAFTEAMLEAFADIPCMDINGAYKADVNNDKIITLAELYDFLKRRVPGMVRSQKPNAPTRQIPFMPENQLNKEDMPIYIIN